MGTKTPVKNAAAERWWLYIAAAVIVFFATIFDNNGTYFTQKVTGLLGAAVIAGMLLFADKARVKRLLTPTAFAVFAYMLLSGISTLWEKFQNAEKHKCTQRKRTIQTQCLRQDCVSKKDLKKQ